MKSGEPVIIVRKKKHGHGGHHGGAWKVAYADFVTAMMAFFLVMWLVTQSKDIKAAVGGYFRDPGIFEYDKGRSPLPGGTPGAEPGGAPPLGKTSPAAQLAEREALKNAAERIRDELTKTPQFGPLRDQIEVTVTTEGLRIELIEKTGSSFFDTGSAALLGQSEQILKIIASELGTLQNALVIEGHTDRRPYTSGDKYGNWELSADRANAARRVMEREGLHSGQVRAIRGFADTQPHIKGNPFDPRNRRVSIVVWSQAAAALEESVHASAGDGSAPAGDAAKPSAPAGAKPVSGTAGSGAESVKPAGHPAKPAH